MLIAIYDTLPAADYDALIRRHAISPAHALPLIPCIIAIDAELRCRYEICQLDIFAMPYASTHFSYYFSAMPCITFFR